MISAEDIIKESIDTVEQIRISGAFGVEAVGFAFRNANAIHAPHTSEMGSDATCKTNKKNMELVVLMAHRKTMGFPLCYVLLTSMDEIEEQGKTMALT